MASWVAHSSSICVLGLCCTKILDSSLSCRGFVHRIAFCGFCTGVASFIIWCWKLDALSLKLIFVSLELWVLKLKIFFILCFFVFLIGVFLCCRPLWGAQVCDKIWRSILNLLVSCLDRWGSDFWRGFQMILFLLKSYWNHFHPNLSFLQSGIEASSRSAFCDEFQSALSWFFLSDLLHRKKSSWFGVRYCNVEMMKSFVADVIKSKV